MFVKVIGHNMRARFWGSQCIPNGFRDSQRRMSRNGWQFWHDLVTTSKQRSRSFIFLPIDLTYTTSYRQPIETFALGRTI